MKRNFIFFILLVLITFHFELRAQDNLISFQKILSEGFENNFDIKLKQLSLTKSNYTLLKASGFLNPFIDSEVVYGEGTNPSFENDGTIYAKSNFVIPTKFGVNFYTGFKLERTTEIDDGTNTLFNGSGAYAGIIIPLLKDLGKYNSENSFIEVSKVNQKALEEQFSNEILIYLYELLNNYLTLKEVVEEYKIDKDILAESKKYKDDIDLLADNDRIPLVEKNRASSFYNTKILAVNLSNITVLEVYYDTKFILGLNDNKTNDSVPVLIDEVADPDKEKLLTYIDRKKNSLDSIVRSTPQYKNISLGVDQNEILLKNAKNQRKNILNLDVRVSQFGSYENGAYNLNSTFNSIPGNSVLVSLKHNIPIKNEKQKGVYLEQLVEYDLSKTYLEKYLYETSTNVRLSLALLNEKIKLYFKTKELVELMKQDSFAQRHIGHRKSDLDKMFKTIGVNSMKELIEETIPENILLEKKLSLDKAMSEQEYQEHNNLLSTKNKLFKTYIGLGYHHTFLPPVIQRNILENPGWYTAYTPYQAEIAQGRLEALINFQTMVCDLTGMELSNASLLDEATAAAEAMALLFSVRDRSQKKNNVVKFFVSEEVLPQTISLLETKIKGNH